MSESTSDYISQLPQSGLTAEQWLTRLVDLIINTTDVEQLDKDRVQNTFGVRLDPFERGREDYAARLTKDWNVTIVVSDDEVAGRSIELEFFDSDEETGADMTDICGVDSDAFSNAMVGAGFSHGPVCGVHGERQGHEYTRGSLRVETATRGEAGAPPERVSHECITSVRIRRHA